MNYFEIAISFLMGLVLVLLLGWVLSFKTKGLVRLAANAVAGGVVLIALTLFNILVLPLNPLNALLTGFLGVPGLIVIYLISVFL